LDEDIIFLMLFKLFHLLELFSENDVSGRKLYGFQTSAKRNSMMLKANQCRSLETPKSFKTLPVLKSLETPKSFKTLPVLKIVLENIKINPKEKGSVTNDSKKGIEYSQNMYICN